MNGLSPELDMTGRKMTPTQTQTLMKIFRGKTYLSKEEVRQLAMSLNVTKKKIENWFCHMRHRRAGEGLLIKGE